MIRLSFSIRPALYSACLGLAGVALMSPDLFAAGPYFPEYVYAIAQDPNSNETLYARTIRGLFRTTDSGKSWGAMAPDSGLGGGGGVLAAAGNPTILFAGSETGGLFRSEDQGASWVKVLGPPVYQIAFGLASPTVGYAVSNALLFRTADSGKTWQLAVSGLPSYGGQVIAADPYDPRVAYVNLTDAPALVRPDEGLYRTINGGSTWTFLAPNFLTTSLFVDPERTNALFSYYESCRPDVCERSSQRSDDAGASWSSASANVSAGDSRGVLYGQTDLSDTHAGHLGSLAFSRSFDHGLSWTPLILPDFAACDTCSISRVFASDVSDLIVGVVSTTVPFMQQVSLLGSRDSGTTWFPIAAPSQTACGPGGNAVCLSGGRFRAAVTFISPPGNTLFLENLAHPVPLTSDAGAFWFFTESNLELVVKVVDGRSVNGKFWLFGGQLTNVEYTLEVTDTVTGVVWTHHNPDGTLESFADTSAF